MSLSHRVAVYVPSKIRDRSMPAMHAKYTRTVLKRLGVMFGGSTMIRGVGTWVDSRGKLVPEKVAICYSFADEAGLIANQSAVFDLARMLAEKMEQEAVSVEMDGQLHLVGRALPVSV